MRGRLQTRDPGPEPDRDWLPQALSGLPATAYEKE